MKNIENEERTYRGGSWYSSAGNCCASGRNRLATDYDTLGFRPVRRSR